MKTEYEYLKEWKRPSCYAGPDWYGWYPILGRSRDSDCLERSNFDAALEALGKSRSVTVSRAGHWAVGWVECIMVKMTAPKKLLEKANHLLKRLDNYPILDENRFSEYEQEEATLVWKDCYGWKERIEYIRKHRDQFEFHDYRDLIGCVRGRWFSGWAGELIR